MRSVLTALCLFATTAHAVPAQFTHQGRLLDADGTPLEGEATIKFRVTDSEEGGDTLWEETLTVPLSSGFYSAILGTDEETNPLDTDVLSQAPVWLELQIDGEPAMFPRSAINAVPYATMATVAEEVAGGPVDASQIAVDGTPVVNELGEWVGPAPTVNWTDIEGMPEDFADGTDDDTDTDTDSFAALGTSCLDGDIPVWDGILTEWACGIDNDTVLTDDEVDAIVADNGYAMESELFSSSFLDLTDVPEGLDDGDDNTQLTESEVDAMVADNGYALAADAFSGLWSALTGIPEDLADGDDNTQLTEADVDAYVADDIAGLRDEIAVLRAQLTELEADVTEGTDSSVGTVMYGDYYIYNSTDLAALEGFTEVRGKLHIESSGLPNIEALNELTTVSGELIIQNCAALTSLEGLNGLVTVESLKISGNDLISSLAPLSSLENLHTLEIAGNNLLFNLEGLEGLTTIHRISIINSDLESFSGLDNLTEFYELHAYRNHSLVSLEGLGSLTNASSGIWLSDNDSLTTTAGLDSLESINHVSLHNNHVLSSIENLMTITAYPGNTLTIQNTAICNSDVSAFEAHIASIGATITSRWVSGNASC